MKLAHGQLWKPSTFAKERFIQEVSKIYVWYFTPNQISKCIKRKTFLDWITNTRAKLI
jgi:hypothetical protein